LPALAFVASRAQRLGKSQGEAPLRKRHSARRGRIATGTRAGFASLPARLCAAALFIREGRRGKTFCRLSPGPEVSFEVPVDKDQAQAKADETRSGLKELGLDEDVSMT
jgi:hypothetical protein